MKSKRKIEAASKRTGKAPPRRASVNGSAALLEIIKTCEEYQNADTEGMELERQCDDAYRTICKVICIASARLDEIGAQQNDQAEL